MNQMMYSQQHAHGMMGRGSMAANDQSDAIS